MVLRVYTGLFGGGKIYAWSNDPQEGVGVYMLCRCCWWHLYAYKTLVLGKPHRESEIWTGLTHSFTEESLLQLPG